MSALTMSPAQPVRAAATAAVAATQQAPQAALQPAVAPERFTQVSPESALNVATETVAAIQQLGSSNVESDSEPKPELRTFQEFQAEGRRWDRYYSQQPRRLQDLLAVYYGSLPGSNASSVDPRGPLPRDARRVSTVESDSKSDRDHS